MCCCFEKHSLCINIINEHCYISYHFTVNKIVRHIVLVYNLCTVEDYFVIMLVLSSVRLSTDKMKNYAIIRTFHFSKLIFEMGMFCLYRQRTIIIQWRNIVQNVELKELLINLAVLIIPDESFWHLTKVIYQWNVQNMYIWNLPWNLYLTRSIKKTTSRI